MNNKLYIKIAAMLAVIALLGAGITALTAPRTSQSDAVRIVTSFYPVYIAAQNVVGDADGVEIVNMVDGQFGCLHDYQMSPADLVTLNSADIFVMNGAGAEPFIDSVPDYHAPSTVIDLSEGIDLLENGHIHEHDGHDHDHEATEDMLTVNDHLWVSPLRYRQQIEILRDGLCEADPARAAIYRANAEDYLAKIDAVYARLQEAVTPFAAAKTVLLHDSLAYLAEDLSLNVAAALNVGEDSGVSAATLSAAEDALKEASFALFLCDSQYTAVNYAYLQTLCERTVVVEVDTCVTGVGSKSHWLDAMTALCEAWEDAV